MSDSVYWQQEVAEAHKLIDSADRLKTIFVGLERARAIIAVEAELTMLKATLARKATVNQRTA